jgi:TonB family protein
MVASGAVDIRSRVARADRRERRGGARRWAVRVALVALGLGAGGAGPLCAAPVSTIDEDVVPPRKVAGEPPAYTEEARLAGIEGAVVVDAVIDEGGSVVEAKILEGLPLGLDRAALDAVANWQFEPATRRGTPVRVRFVLTVNFKFDNDYDFGPVFALFLRRNPDFAALYRGGRFADAMDLLDRWPEPEEAMLPLARAYVWLGSREPRAAWESVKADPAPPPIEVLRNIAGWAGVWAVNGSLSDAARVDYAAVALEAATMALETDGRDTWSLIATARLLRLKVWLGVDAAHDEALLAEAQRLEAQAEAAGGLSDLER